MMDISIPEILTNVKKFLGSRLKFPGKREISKPQISRPEFPGGNITP